MKTLPTNWIEWLYYAFNVVLVIGVVGSIVAVANPTENLTNYISLIFVAIGTVGAVALGWALGRRSNVAIARAHKAASDANERAQLACLEAMQLRARLAWRRLGARENAVILERLRQVPESERIGVWVQYVDSDPEVVIFQEDIHDVLSRAGLKPVRFPGWMRAVGLKVGNAHTPMGRAICEAFNTAGLRFNAVTGAIPDAPGQNDVQILVGSRPPPPGSNVAY